MENIPPIALDLEFDISGRPIQVSISSQETFNQDIQIDTISKIKYGGEEILKINLLDYLKFKGNVFFVDKTVPGPYVPPVPNQRLLQQSDQKYPLFEISDFETQKLNNLGIVFHSFSKGTVGKTSVVIHSDSNVSGKMKFYQIFVEKTQITNKVAVDHNTIATAYDTVQFNGQNYIIVAFLTLEGNLRIDTAKSNISSQSKNGEN
jgi:hypothetical protein